MKRLEEDRHCYSQSSINIRVPNPTMWTECAIFILRILETGDLRLDQERASSPVCFGVDSGERFCGWLSQIVIFHHEVVNVYLKI